MACFLFCLAAIPTAKAQSPSARPACYICPDADLAGFDLTLANYDTSTIYMSCEFTAPWHCTYDPSTGDLKDDFDTGLCPAKAIWSCGDGRRRAVRNVIPRAFNRPSTQMTREEESEVVQFRGKVGKRRLK
ncbi:hypothetical protein FA15DRAFT_703005 [Coprinopsis marcescibilis]|uniref:Uncharacterized protein n=1 Tax=Coprinopsis marcescibilis TaxID=230819 RepID=A0A5C3L1V0_COPMA|nr:hypothetical protein FA15DRAFT_703005 [Coprinopsis marcescibilis]